VKHGLPKRRRQSGRRYRTFPPTKANVLRRQAKDHTKDGLRHDKLCCKSNGQIARGDIPRPNPRRLKPGWQAIRPKGRHCRPSPKRRRAWKARTAPSPLLKKLCPSPKRCHGSLRSVGTRSHLVDFDACHVPTASCQKWTLSMRSPKPTRRRSDHRRGSGATNPQVYRSRSYID
jgi:hypothetical protein